MIINKVGRFEKVTGDEYAYTMLANDDDIDWVNYDKIVLPNRATNHSAGYDFYLTRDIELQPGESVVIDGEANVEYVPLCGKCYMEKVMGYNIEKLKKKFLHKKPNVFL